MLDAIPMRTRAGRLVGAGIVAALAVGLSGRLVERIRFGGSDAETLSRVEADLRARFDADAAMLAAVTAQTAGGRDVIRAALLDPQEKGLFALVSNALPAERAGRVGVTVYDAAGRPVAWAGRVSDLPKTLINGLPALVTVPGALGPRLVRVEPVSISGRNAVTTRDATVVVEQALADPQPTPMPPDTAVVPTPIVPVTVRTPAFSVREGVPEPPSTGNFTFNVLAPSGAVLVDAEVARQDLAFVRARLRNRVWAIGLTIFAATILLAIGPMLDLRRRASTRTVYLGITAIIAGVLIGARALVLSAISAVADFQTLDSPLNILVTSLPLLALVALAASVVARRRVASPRPAYRAGNAPAFRFQTALFYLLAGAAGGFVIAEYELFLQRVVTRTHLDVLHFSLHPLDMPRFAVGFGLILMHTAIVWGVATLVHAVRVFRRVGRRDQVVPAMAWCAGGALVVVSMSAATRTIPLAPALIALAMAGVCAMALARWPIHARHATQAARLTAFFLALAAPSVALYPSLFAFGTAAKEKLIETEYAPQAVTQRDELRNRLFKTLDQVDALPTLADFLRGGPGPSTERALAVWSTTDLARFRLTSAVELYNADGALVSRFALNLPEYTTLRHVTDSCEWEVFEEVLPFGASERYVPQASRGICGDDGVVRGAIVVRVMLDYRTLPFLSSQNPYLESLRPERVAAPEGSQGNDIEFVAYGWGRAPFNEAGTSTWLLPDDLFRRLVETREPSWTTLPRNESNFRVYFISDRAGIYALGYPVPTTFNHLVNLAELMVLVGVLYVLLLVGASIFSTVTAVTPASGRELLREFRASFYRKLFLAYVAVAVVPVALLAFGVRTYFARQADADLEDSAAKTATVAQRLVEDYASLQQRGATTLAGIDDPVMVLVSRAIGQDVNLFDRSGLEASSQRDLFASGLLSMRTPSSAYVHVILERLPVFVGVEQIADFPYRIAAAPVRAGARDGIVTVPLPLGQQQLERQIDELDRQVIFGAVLVMLLGAAMGYWMAERIADPVNRLTRATRRIARGDLDARIAATSADELGRLVHDFNGMADDLKRQRTELERTQRLEAWAEMARQVAHDIKNPLTPIQLSAEHAQRVNVDKGRPLSPALDECVGAILHQVTLLRQIASEFSSFASSPTARPEPARLPPLLEEVVASYRTGLAGRVAITVDAPADLPRVSIDRTLFSRALTNIIENALHAMPAGGRIDIRASRLGARVSISITDNGLGMDDDALVRIFEPYFSTKATGTGLGLTIAKRNVELTGGTIDVASAKGAGTTVTITLPAAAA